MVAVALTVLAAAVPARAQADAHRLVDGAKAPEFSLLDTSGKRWRLQDHAGKVLVLNFWAYWCNTWEQELPHLQELTDRQKDLGFQLVAVSVDGARLQEFLKRTRGKLPDPVLLDPGSRITQLYRVSHVPTLIVLDRKGRVRSVQVGFPGTPVMLNLIRGASG